MGPLDSRPPKRAAAVAAGVAAVGACLLLGVSPAAPAGNNVQQQHHHHHHVLVCDLARQLTVDSNQARITPALTKQNTPHCLNDDVLPQARAVVISVFQPNVPDVMVGGLVSPSPSFSSAAAGSSTTSSVASMHSSAGSLCGQSGRM